MHVGIVYCPLIPKPCFCGTRSLATPPGPMFCARSPRRRWGGGGRIRRRAAVRILPPAGHLPRYHLQACRSLHDRSRILGWGCQRIAATSAPGSPAGSAPGHCSCSVRSGRARCSTMLTRRRGSFGGARRAGGGSRDGGFGSADPKLQRPSQPDSRGRGRHRPKARLSGGRLARGASQVARRSSPARPSRRNTDSAPIRVARRLAARTIPWRCSRASRRRRRDAFDHRSCRARAT